MVAASVGIEVDGSVATAEGTDEAAGWVSPAGVSGAGVLAGGAAASGFAGGAEVAAGTPAVAAIEYCQFRLFKPFSSWLQVPIQLTGTQSFGCAFSIIGPLLSFRA